MRNLLFAEQRQKLRIEIVHTLCAVDDENGNVGLVKNALRAQYALTAEILLVVIKARRVGHDHGSERQQLHRLLHGVGGGAGAVGDQGEVLRGHGVDQTRFSGVAPAEKADVNPVRRRGIVETHGSASFGRYQK